MTAAASASRLGIGTKAAYGMSLKALMAFPQAKVSKETRAQVAEELASLGL